MNGFIVKSPVFLSENKAVETAKKKRIIKVPGKKGSEMGSQIPLFEKELLYFCSYYCEGYEKSYQQQGWIIETDARLAYASPGDTFSMQISGTFIPGYKKYIFRSIDDMLEKYPSSQDYFRNLKEHIDNIDPLDVFPELSTSDADSKLLLLKMQINENLKYGSCNEIAFIRPMKIRIIDYFLSRDELEEKFKEMFG